MAIMSFIVNCDLEHVQKVFDTLESFEELELHGIHNGYQIVAVGDMEADKMEEVMARVGAIEHVQTCELSYVNLEDEID